MVIDAPELKEVVRESVEDRRVELEVGAVSGRSVVPVMVVWGSVDVNACLVSSKHAVNTLAETH